MTLLDLTEDVQTIEEVIPYADSDDPTKRTHIINPPKNLHIWREGMTAQDIVDIARASGQPVQALCGYIWVPVHNPDKYDLCEPCREIASQIMSNLGE